MQQAVEAVRKGESIRSAALMFNVAKSTIHDHVTGKAASRGPSPYLTTTGACKLFI